MKLDRIFTVFVILFLSAFGVAFAQWVDQEMNLNPGWNAVYLEVEPETDSCDEVFDALPVEGVWMFNSHTAKTQFRMKPEDMVVHRPDWMVWRPEGHKDRDAIDLYNLIGGKAYLIKVGGEEPVNIIITGTVPVYRHVWAADSKNFTGFTVDEINPPTFAEFFKSSPAHANSSVYCLDHATGMWREADTKSETMQRGEGFWIDVNGVSEWQAPIDVNPEYTNGLEFGVTSAEIILEVTNLTDEERLITFTLDPSDEPRKTDEHSPVAGMVPVSYYYVNLDEKVIDWIPLDDPYAVTIKPGFTKPVKFKVRRNDLSPPAPGANPKAPVYQSLLHVSDGSGYVETLPVNVRPHSTSSVLFGGKRRNVKSLPSNMPYDLRRGLWVGSAVIEAVAEVNSSSDPLTPRPAASTFSFPIIVHIDENDNARLLNEVYIMHKPSTYIEDPENPGETIVDEYGYRVLLTDESRLDSYDGVYRLGHEMVGRRISTTAFASSKPDVIKSEYFSDPLTSTQFPVLMQADSSTSPILYCSVKLDYNDPLNPFKHKYHPDHDNLGERFDEALPEGRESWDVTRLVKLAFSENDPRNRTSKAGWGDTEVGGIYHETITGIHKDPINVSGYFDLRNILSVEILNDGNGE